LPPSVFLSFFFTRKSDVCHPLSFFLSSLLGTRNSELGCSPPSPPRGSELGTRNSELGSAEPRRRFVRRLILDIRNSLIQHCNDINFLGKNLIAELSSVFNEYVNK
jgi:hypothetical protein